MIDFHTHTILSDGELVPSELVRRALVRGYRGIALTDHVDGCTIDAVVPALARFAGEIRGEVDLEVIPGAEITHVPPGMIASLVGRARELGALFVVVHGETLAEPVAPGTNEAALKAGADLLSHPGLITEDLAILAAKKGIHLEISSRKGHCLANGHVAKVARSAGAPLLVNTDAHAPGDLIDDEEMMRVAAGAGLDREEARSLCGAAERLMERLRDGV